MPRKVPATAGVKPAVENCESSYNYNIALRIKDLRREAEEHAGMLVARSPDGRHDYPYYVKTYDEIYALLVADGVQPHEVVVERVRDPEECAMF
jgi:hypothetical protein